MDKLLVVAENSPIVSPAVNSTQAVEAFKAYQELEKALLTESDYIYYVSYRSGQWPKKDAFETRSEAEEFAPKVHGKILAYKKKVAYRKMAVFFGLSLPKELIEEEPVVVIEKIDDNHYVKTEKRKSCLGVVYMDGQFRVLRAEWTITVQQVRADGKVFISQGTGSSANNEKMTKDGHNIISTAYTRALNRAIADLVGFGEVSAEEVMTADDEEVIEGVSTPVEKPKTDEAKARGLRIATLAKSLGYKVDVSQVVKGISGLVNQAKTGFSQLNDQEEDWLMGYLSLQIGKDADAKKAAKEYGKTVLAYAKATECKWEEALKNCHQDPVVSKEPDLAKEIFA